MADNDIYNSKRRYELFVKLIDALVLPPLKPSRRKYICKNPTNLHYFHCLVPYFEARDTSYISTVTGKADIALRIHVHNPEQLNEEVSKIRDLPFVERTETLVGLHSVEKNQLTSGLSSGVFRKKQKGFEKIRKG